MFNGEIRPFMYFQLIRLKLSFWIYKTCQTYVDVNLLIFISVVDNKKIAKLPCIDILKNLKKKIRSPKKKKKIQRGKQKGPKTLALVTQLRRK